MKEERQQEERIDFQSLAISLLHYHHVILPDILPSGKLIGKEWCCGDINGQAGNSFKFNTEKGTFKDFASGEGGKDIIALYAKQTGTSMLDSAKYLRSKYLGSQPLIKYSYPVKKFTDSQEIIKPPIDAEPPPIPSNAKSWCYRDLDGSPIYYIIRQEDQNGKKFFYPLSFSNKDKWIKKHYPNPPLYNIDKIAADLSKPILIVEGEKAADAATIAMKPYTVTTWPMGANNWNKMDWTALKGRKVLLWPDADEAGRIAMNQLAIHLYDIASEIKLIATDKSNGWDADNAFLSDGWTYKEWANWAKPLTSLHQKPQKVEVLDPQEELQVTSSAVEDLEDLIPTQDFPVSPNWQMRFLDLGLQFSDSKKSKVVMNASNVAKIIGSDFKDMVWRDTFYNKIFTKWTTGVERQWSDTDTNNLFIKMQHHYELAKISKQHIQDAIEFIASKNEKNEPQEWLATLKWDGISRIDDFFIKAMGSKDSTYTRAVSKNFWIALVARIMDAGCKADEMVVLEGKQGTFKTTSLEIIGGKWYGEVNCDIASKDFDQGLRGKILVEFGELANLRKTDVETIKRKLSTRVDEYRPSYGRYVEQHPRTCIFVGTTNETEYLKDATGNRRFWPMEIVRADTDYIRGFRDQFFAEALTRFKAGERWHEVPWEEAEEVRSSRMETDEWDNIISEIISRSGMYQTSYFTLYDVWRDMGATSEKLSKGEQIRLANSLKRLNCHKVIFKLGTKATKGWKKI